MLELKKIIHNRAPLARKLLFCLFPKIPVTYSVMNSQILVVVRLISAFGNFFLYDSIIISNLKSTSLETIKPTTKTEGNA